MDILPKLKSIPPPQKLKVGNFYFGIISFYDKEAQGKDFYFQFNIFKEYMNHIRRECLTLANRNERGPSVDDLGVGTLVLAINPDDGLWYRAVIQEIIKDRNIINQLFPLHAEIEDEENVDDEDKIKIDIEPEPIIYVRVQYIDTGKSDLVFLDSQGVRYIDAFIYRFKFPPMAWKLTITPNTPSTHKLLAKLYDSGGQVEIGLLEKFDSSWREPDSFLARIIEPENWTEETTKTSEIVEHKVCWGQVETFEFAAQEDDTPGRFEYFDSKIVGKLDATEHVETVSTEITVNEARQTSIPEHEEETKENYIQQEIQLWEAEIIELAKSIDKIGEQISQAGSENENPDQGVGLEALKSDGSSVTLLPLAPRRKRWDDAPKEVLAGVGRGRGRNPKN